MRQNLISASRIFVTALLFIQQGVFATALPQLQSPLQSSGFDMGDYVVIGVQYPDGTVRKFDGCNQVLHDATLGKILSPGSANCFGATPLHLAASESPDSIPFLLKRGANIEARMERGLTPLHLAISVGQIESVKLLLEEGANVNTESTDGETLLHTLYVNRCGLCKPEERRQLTRLLLDFGLALDDTDNNDSTALHYAVMLEDSNGAVDDLASLGADFSIKDDDGTPLWFYASLRDEKVADKVRLLAGDSINSTNDYDKDRDTWVRETKESIDSVSEDFVLTPVVRRTHADTSSYSIGLRPLRDYFRPMHPADLTAAERSFCSTVASTVCGGVCAFLRKPALVGACASICIPIVEKACAYIIHGDIPPCPVTVVIDEDGTHHIVTVPCPM